MRTIRFEGLTLRECTVSFEGQEYLLADARAEVEIGGTQRRTTATRVIVGSAITLGVGTVIGAMAKKKTNNVYLSVDLADGHTLLVEAKPKKEGEARKFANELNNRAARC